jgi:hypothetical protein
MAKSLYIKKPGGAILHEVGGEHRQYMYGEKLDLDKLTEAQRNNLDHVTTTKRPSDAPVTGNEEAQIRAAEAEANNVNSTATPVPANYDQLTEDEAVRLIGSMKDPSAQSAVLQYEIQHENRERVLNAGHEDAVAQAEVRATVADFEAKAVTDAGEPPRGVSKKEGTGPEPGEGIPITVVDDKGGTTTPAPTASTDE